MTSAEVTDYSSCTGLPHNEDKLCSDFWAWPFVAAYGYQDHICYFEHHVGDWCSDGIGACAQGAGRT